MPKSTFIEVFEFGALSATTSWSQVDKRDPENQKVESYVVAFRYYDAKSGRGKRTNVSPTYFVTGEHYTLKTLAESPTLKDRDEILLEMAKREISQAVIINGVVYKFEKGDVILKRQI